MKKNILYNVFIPCMVLSFSGIYGAHRALKPIEVSLLTDVALTDLTGNLLYKTLAIFVDSHGLANVQNAVEATTSLHRTLGKKTGRKYSWQAVAAELENMQKQAGGGGISEAEVKEKIAAEKAQWEAELKSTNEAFDKEYKAALDKDAKNKSLDAQRALFIKVVKEGPGLKNAEKYGNPRVSKIKANWEQGVNNLLRDIGVQQDGKLMS